MATEITPTHPISRVSIFIEKDLQKKFPQFVSALDPISCAWKLHCPSTGLVRLSHQEGELTLKETKENIHFITSYLLQKTEKSFTIPDENILFTTLGLRKYRQMFAYDADDYLKIINLLVSIKNLALHLFFHQKGDTQVFYRSSDLFENQNQLKIKEFNTLQKHFYKSKNRQHSTKDFDLLTNFFFGTFVAIPIETNSYSSLLIFTRSEFIPFEDDIVKDLISVSKLASFNLEKMFHETSEVDHSLKELKEAIKTFEESHINPAQDFSHIQEFKIKLLGDLFNTLKHELSNPLFGLGLSTEVLLSDENTSTEDRVFLGEIKNNVNRSQLLINNLSQLFNENFASKKCDPIEITNEALTLAKSRIKHIKVHRYFNSLETKVIGSPVFLVQIIFNLLVNAAQALEQTTNPEIEIHIKESEHFLTISVCDNGPGVDEHLSENLFKPYESSKKDGHGIGLALSRFLANKMGGDLLYSKESLTKFDIHLKKHYE